VFVGIDVGATRLHCVVLDEARRLEEAWQFGTADPDGLVEKLAGARFVAIDAPAQLSSMPHRDDATLSPKFRAARCAEIALGRERRCWVPWVAPPTEPESGWMRVGLDLFAAFAGSGTETIEVFPYAGFRALAGGARLPTKRREAGVRARAQLLAAAAVGVPDLATWSHDGLDALLAAATAHDAATGRAVCVTCGHDDSAIWLPGVAARA
jgi:predicted nuclease with RNAse H fold